MGTWIDFRQLRAQLKFEDVLLLYGVEVKRKGEQHHGFCPLPSHNGKKNSPSFSANLAKGIFNCFGCGAKGNALEFAAMMEGVSVDNGAELRKVAIKLRDKFLPEAGNAKKAERQAEPKKPKPDAEQPDLVPNLNERLALRVRVNEPLDFELKQLDPNHPYLDKRGFSKETISHFGLGYCAKGLLAERIAIPVHDMAGKLVGYCGRMVDDTRISEDNPRYKFPPKRERNGVAYEFHKSLLLYNGHRISEPVDDLAIVEGFASVWWLTQMGFPDVVALMGWAMSDEQAKLVCEIVRHKGRVWVIPDGDESGTKCAHSVFERIAPHLLTRWLKLDEGKQPTDYPGGWYKTYMKC